ncbi:PHD finger protein 6 isoform X1 [Prionailurus iriomotensis]
MEQALSSSAKDAPDQLPHPTGVAEKMEKRTCALCPKDSEYSVLYIAKKETIAAHENCLLYSSALVECEDHDPSNDDRSFDVESVKKEIHRGRRLTCAFCNKRGATVGCDIKACLKSYHFFCAKNAHAVLQTDRSRGIYNMACFKSNRIVFVLSMKKLDLPSDERWQFSFIRQFSQMESRVFCQQHAALKDTHDGKSLSGISPTHYKQKTNRGYGLKRKRGRKKRLSTGVPVQPSETMTLNRFIQEMKGEESRHTDAIGSSVKIDFLKKCKRVGLLDDLFEEILDKLHLIQERLMDETASESDYEEIGTSLFDSRLFEDTFVNFQTAIENKIDQCEERQKQLKEEIEGLQDLKKTLRSLQEDRELRSSSTSVSSGSSKDYYFLGQE